MNATTFAACAHRQVVYEKQHWPGGTCSDKWVCAQCGTSFLPAGFHPAGTQELKRPVGVETNREDVNSLRSYESSLRAQSVGSLPDQEQQKGNGIASGPTGLGSSQSKAHDAAVHELQRMAQSAARPAPTDDRERLWWLVERLLKRSP